ncbi:MAG: hypothetical protein ACEPOZ_09825 [Marinifilaceae bacterium]
MIIQFLFFWGLYIHLVEFYTSYFDLSDLSSYKVGLGFQYTPIMGIGNFKSPFRRKKTTPFKSTGLRTTYNNRSDSLNSWLLIFELASTF